MLNWKVVTKSLGSFAAISYVLCIGAGLLIPSSLHASWLLEAMLPGFKWLSLGSFVLGLVEASVYGAWAGCSVLDALQLLRPTGAPGHDVGGRDGTGGVTA